MEKMEKIDHIEEEYSKKRAFVNRLKSTFTNPYNLMVLISVIFMTYLIVVPLGQMVYQTFTLTAEDALRLGETEGMFTLYYWKRVFASPISRQLLYEPLMNSLFIAVTTSFLAILIGSLFAWLMVRSDLPYKKFFSFALIIPYMLPSWSKATAWLTIFKNDRIGGAGGLLGFLGIQTPDWLAYGSFAIIAVLVIHYYAYAYLLVSSALSSVNSELEEMGEVLGANKPKILRKITLPLVLPAILSAVILTFSKTMGTFGVPSILGMKVGYYTISTSMYSSINNGQAMIGYVISLVLIIIASISVFINQRAIGSRKSYSTIGGKGGRSNPIRLGKMKKPITIILFIFVAIAVVFPVVILLYQSLMLETGNFSFDNLTLHYWLGGSVASIDQGEPGILRNPQFIRFVWNSIKLVFFTSIFATILGQIIGYINSRGRSLFSGKLVEQLVFIPYLIPSIAFGAMYLSLFASDKTIDIGSFRFTLVPSLYGTFALIVLIAVVKHLPFAARAGTSTMLQISTELEEAAQIEKAGFFKRMLRVVLPLSKSGVISGFMLVFISIMKELDLFVILMTSSQQTLPYMAFTYTTENFIQLSSAVTIVMFVMVFFVYWFTNKYTDADISKGI